MVAKLSAELVRELEEAGDQPLPVENPKTNRVYVLVDVERYEVVRRPSTANAWTEQKNARRSALIRQKFTRGITSAEIRELEELQDELAAFRQRSVPLPFGSLDELRAALDSSVANPEAPAS